jgi:DNA polymerase elongation subunit (family B)
MFKKTVSPEKIEQFLEGRDPQKYIVAIEGSAYEPIVNLVVNHPEKGKVIQKHQYKPFLWLKKDVSKIMYGGDRIKIQQAAAQYKVTFKGLTHTDDEGNIPERMKDGYNFIAHTTESFNNLKEFFKNGGVDVYDSKYRNLFLMFKPDEQFMIQTGKRLFKGMDDYDDVHRFQFDLETEGLDPVKHGIFQIGIRDNRGFEFILETTGETEQERRDSERSNIKDFFKAIESLTPDLITGYNSESFDWGFFYERCDRLSIDIKKISRTLNPKKKIYRYESTLKLGNESEKYQQTYMWGYNVIDISHAVRRAQSINSDIKKWGLKYITMFSEVEKDNRVYVNGDKLNETWADTKSDYYLNNANGDWFKYDGSLKSHVRRATDPESGYKKVTGAYIVQRYLMDDLWETEVVDSIYNQAGFLLGKWIPTNFQRSTTMGTAGIWALLMAAWSYETDLAIPSKQDKPDFTGGLSRLLEVGYAENVVKLDYAALYPNTELTHDIFPEFDISGVMKGMLLYIAETRDKYKALKNEHAAKGDSRKADFYDKKQLPIKILANSFFGAFGAPHIFPWGDIDCAEETTCRGRQYLRLMVKHFWEKHRFRPLVGDTDGFNFAVPEHVKDIKYTPKGTHRMTEEYAGKELTGVDAVVAEFNEEYMIGRMGLDIDDVCKSTINFARKNYANWIIKKNKDGSDKLKLKLVGNTVKSKVMATYIEEFIDKGIIMLLDGRGKDFIEFYYDYVEKIFNYEIPISKIASKSKVNELIDHYRNVYLKKTTKAGQQASRKAHMELAILHNLNIDLGDNIYYINTGTAKSHSDVKKVNIMKKNEETGNKEETGKVEIQFNCEYIPMKEIEREEELLKEIKELEDSLEVLEGEKKDKALSKIDELKSELIIKEYNVAKYIEALNNRIKKLFIVFDPEVRSQVAINVYKDKESKTLKLQPRKTFTNEQCKMIAGKPFEEKDQDKYEDLMMFEDKEFNFWIRTKKLPNNIDTDEFERLKKEYVVRRERERKEGMENEMKEIIEVIRRFELKDYKKISKSGKMPKSFEDMAILDDTNGDIYSIKYGHKLCNISDYILCEEEAKLRDVFYKEAPSKIKKASAEIKFEAWLEHLTQKEIEDGVKVLEEKGIVYLEPEFDYKLWENITLKEHFYEYIGLPLRFVNEFEKSIQDIKSDDIKELKDSIEKRKNLTLKEILEQSDDVFTF